MWGIARAVGAKIILRIDDHDTQRSRKAFEQSILDDLAWLGFAADEGVRAVDTPSPFRQSDCLQRYHQDLALLSRKKITYVCTCSRKQILHASSTEFDELHYKGSCREKRLSDSPQCSVRIIAPDHDYVFVDGWLGPQTQNIQQQCGDFTLRDRHGCFTYQFNAASDDVAQGVNLIIRGQDLTPSTGRQMFLKSELCPQKANTCVYLHHPLLTDDVGKKLSKRFFSEAIEKRRTEGATAESVIKEACNVSGISFLRDLSTLDDIVAAFRASLASSAGNRDKFVRF